MSTYNTLPIWEQHIIYLRKSRQDDPRETVEEVLEKHETILQEFAVREFGHKIPAGNIYREIVSGESISEREEIQEVLRRISDPNVKGVLVVEPSRLSRGDLTDCGHLIDAFRYSKTLVVTPYMTYDLEKKMERKFFQDELLRGNDYLEYTKEILWRGRVAAAKRGCYSVGGPPPFGYKKVKVGKDWTLEIVPEDAEVVRMIFDWYTNDKLTPIPIAKRLTEMGIKTPTGGDVWKHSTIRRILENQHYLGLIVFSRRKTMTFIEYGEKVKRSVMQKNPQDVIIAPGKHEPIIDEKTFAAAQEVTCPHPRTKEELELKNALAGILYCGKCGKPLHRSADKGKESRYFCKGHKPRCFKSTVMTVVDAAVLEVLETAELPALRMKVQNDEGNAIKIQQRLIAKLQTQLSELEDQEDSLYDLLERKVYSDAVFARRHSALETKMEKTRADLEKAKRAMPKSIDYEERADALEEAIAVFKDPNATAAEKNTSLKGVISRIEYYGTPIGGTKRFYNPFTLKVFLRL